MAGYRIEYTGGLVSRRDVPQATSSGSLVQQNNLHPSYWENMDATMGAPFSPVLQYNNGQGPVPDWIYWKPVFFGGADIGISSYNAGNTILFVSGAPADIAVSTPSNLPVDTYTFEIRATYNSNVYLYWYTSNPSNPTSRIANDLVWAVVYMNPNGYIGPLNTSSFQTYTVNITTTVPNQAITLRWRNLTGSTSNEVDYFKLYNSAGVNILDSTQTAGAAPTGGAATSATPTTIQDGVTGVSGPPSEIVVSTTNGAQDVVEVRSLEPAEATEDSHKELRNKRIITATDTSISTSVTGLDATNIINSEGTSIEVLELKNATEN